MGFDFRGWARQPSTIIGFGTILGLVASAIANYEGGSVSAMIAAGGLVFGLVHLVLPDNSQAAADAQAMAIDVLKGAVNHTLGVQIPQILRDGMKFMSDMSPSKPLVIAAQPATVKEELAQSIKASILGASELGLVANAGPASGIPPVAAGIFALMMMGIGLSACSTPQLQLACKTDQALLPVAGATLGALVPEASLGIAIDQALVHPAVVKYCQDLGGKPVATSSGAVSIVTPSAPPPATPPPTTTPAAAQ